MGLQSRMVRAALILAALAVSSVTSLAQTIVRPPVAGAPTPPVIAPSVIAPQLMPPVAAAPSPSMVPPHVLAPPRPTFGPAVDGVISPVAPVAPQVAQPAGRRVALVIGNSAYQNTTALANPANDATIMAQALRDVGFEVIDGVDLDRRGLDLKIRDFARALGTADAGLFYYAGHGLQVGGQNYLVPVDARLESERDLDFEAVKIDFVLRQMEIDREAKTNIVFLDACRDNPLSRNLARSMGTRSAGLGRGLAQVQTGVGTFISFSTQPGNVALDGQGRNSPFTAALTKALATPDRTITSVMIDVRKDVLAATGGKQVPWDHSALTGDFYFQQASAPGALQQAKPGTPDNTQERLRQLEEALKQKSSPQQTADTVELAQSRERLRTLEEANKADQKRIFDTQYSSSRSAGDAQSRANLSFEIGAIQMQIGRRVQETRTLRERITKLEETLGLKPVEPLKK